MNLLLAFCAYMTFIYVPWDIFFKPLAEDVEVWFGYALVGWWAKAGAVLHWLVYGFGTWGFWHMKRWLPLWAAIYILQIAFSMLVWATLEGRSSWWQATIVALVFVLLALALFKSRDRFGQQATKQAD